MTTNPQMIRAELELNTFMQYFTLEKSVRINDIPLNDWTALVNGTLLPYKAVIATQTFPNQKRVYEVCKEIDKVCKWTNQDPAMLNKLAKKGSGGAGKYKDLTIYKMIVAMRRLNNPSYDLDKAVLVQDIHSTNQAINEEINRICTFGQKNSPAEKNASTEQTVYVTSSETKDHKYSKFQSAFEDRQEIERLSELSASLKEKLRNIKQSRDLYDIFS